MPVALSHPIVADLPEHFSPVTVSTAKMSFAARLVLMILLYVIPASNQADNQAAVFSSTTVEQEIQAMFPKLTRIGEPLTTLPVIPVYQLDSILGYAWISTDINDIPGFAGKPIKLLIGLDSAGVFRDVKVLDHHEPVFLHGLGEQALSEFVAQYRGHSISRQVIVSSGQNRRSNDSGDDTNSGPVYFDGVTKATVSVIVINDVALSTALRVARETLEGFALPAQSILKEKSFSPMGWRELLQSGLVHHWRLSSDEAFSELGRALDDYPAIFSPLANDEEVFTDLYYAYLNIEDAGRNLLGDHWQSLMDNLKPDEHLIWVGSGGLYPHVSADFTPGTVPPRLSLDQSGLAIELRDTNALPAATQPVLPGTPGMDYAHIFRIKGMSGFDPGSPVSLRLNISLPRNHLMTDSLTLESAYQSPAHLWEKQEIADPLMSSDPLWLRIWHDRIPQISILFIGLVLLLYVFTRQNLYIQNARSFSIFRWVYLWFTLLFIGFYAQGQLSVVNIFTLLHAIRDGFDITVFMLDPVIFILWIVTFLSLFIWGRGLFCGWLCPFGALQEIASKLGKIFKFKQIRIQDKLHRKLIYLKYPILIGLVLLSFESLTWAERLAEIEPFKTSITLVFVRHWPFVLYAVGLLLVGMFIHKFYCRYLCPLGAGLAIVGFFHRYEWLDRIKMCGSPCQICNNRCEIRAITRSGEIDYNECIQCLECVVILNDEKQCADKLLQRKRKTATAPPAQPIRFDPIQVTDR